MNRHNAETRHFRMLTSIGYLLIALLVGGIMYTWLGEWRDMEGLEAKNREIDEFRKEVNNIHIHLIEFSLLGETILEWDDEDLGLYHARRMTMDSMLCRFKAIYPVERIDSVRNRAEECAGTAQEIQAQGFLRHLWQKGRSETNCDYYDAPFP